MARWSDVADDPLRDDDALGRDEDVLRDAAADDAEAAERSGTAHAVPHIPSPSAPLDDRPTTEISRVAQVAPEPESRGLRAVLAPWALFAVAAVIVVAATSTWASYLQGPTVDRANTTPLIQPVPTAAAPPAAAPEPAPPAPTPSVEPEEPAPEPTARATQRPRATRAPVAPPRATRAPTQAPPPSGAAPPSTGAGGAGGVVADGDQAGEGDASATGPAGANLNAQNGEADSAGKDKEDEKKKDKSEDSDEDDN